MSPHVKVTMIIPSRGRPRAAGEAAMSALEHATRPNTQVVIAVDGPHDPPTHNEYAELLWTLPPGAILLTDPVHRGMVGTLNRRATQIVRPELMQDHRCRKPEGECGRVTHVGFMGDDHRVRTHGWDQVLADAAGLWGVAYGNDLLQGEALPTAVLMSADIVRVLGRMAPPEMQHLYVDNYWLELGRSIGSLHYRGQVIIEHLHFSVGKAPHDEQYDRVNAPEQYERDGAAWRTYVGGGALLADVLAIGDACERGKAAA